MRPLSVFVSHSGKTVELEVGPHVRVEAVQQTLADLTGISRADQILMCEGARLEGAKPLAAYGLPGEEHDKVHDVFLYSRAHLRPDAPLPPPEQLPECPLDLSGLDSIQQQRHRLDWAGSPLLRLLPDYQRQFQQHLLQANARLEASQQRMATCARLVSEQEVQALSIDAATSNVELHYAYICDAYGKFMALYRQQHAQHAEVLSRFEADLQYLAATELHPALRSGAVTSTDPSASGGAGGAPAMPATLLHLVNAEQLREASAACARGHQHFGGKVSELEGLFGMLKADVDALFMQAPSVDLEALMRQLEGMHQQLDEQASITAALSSDLSKVQQLVEQASQQLIADPAASVQVSDTVHMLETMRETHVAHLLPRVEACHQAVEGFAAHCLECKNALTRDVFSQLRTISSQQSKIREMKNKLALFREALARQESAVQDLLVVRRVPAAYKQCLAECVRRQAFMEKYAHSAAQLAERMGAFREKELAMRESFRKHVERLIPGQLLERMGLLEQPPHCQVSVSSAEGERLLAVTIEDVRRIQLPWGASSALAPLPSPTSAAAAGGRVTATGSRDAAAGDQQQQRQQQEEEASAAGAVGGDVDATARLQLENARLRAELASQLALDCIRSVQLVGTPTSGGAPTAAAQRGGASGSGQASPQLALSSAGSPRPPALGGLGVSGALGAPQAGPAAAAGAGAAVPPEAAQRFERALAAKDGLAAELQAQLSVSRRQAAAYEARIQHLEEQLAALAASVDGRHAATTGDASVGPTPAAGAEAELLASSLASQTAARTAGSGTAAASSAASSPASSLLRSGTSSAQVPAAERCAASSTAANAGMTASEAASVPATSLRVGTAQAADLASSVDAAAGSSLAGSLHAPDPSRSLGPSSSLPTSQPLQQQQQTAAAQEPQQAGSAARAPAVGGEEQPVHGSLQFEGGSAMQPGDSQPAAGHSGGAGGSTFVAPGTAGSPEALASGSAVLGVAHPAEQGPFASSPTALAASGEHAIASPAPPSGTEAAWEVGGAGTPPAAGAQAEDFEGVPAALPLPLEPELAARQTPLDAPLPALDAASQPRPPLPSQQEQQEQPQPLQRSVVVDEGSDVEGIEPLEDSEDEDDRQGGSDKAGSSPTGGYESAS